jgi:Amt family ammonium transporter
VSRTLEQVARELDTTWIIVAAVLVMFMQAGFACLEIASRGARTSAASSRR